jgi:ABC-type transport system substrate-binding protein
MAMSMAIDRAALAEGLFAGLAWPAGNWAISVNHPLHKDEWTMQFDPVGAKQLMTEAGYPNGFTAGMWPGEEVTELAQVVASMWDEHLGITIEFHTAPWSAIVDKFVTRTINWLLFDGEQAGMPIHYAKAREAQAWFEGGIMWSGGIPFFQTVYGEMMKEPDEAKRTDWAIQFGDHEAYWHWDPGLYEYPYYTIYKGSAMDWQPTSESMHTQIGNYLFPLEDVTLK